jgi:hypothetical protein
MSHPVNIQIIESLYEDLICLCEIRGELDPGTNAATERRIKEIESQLKDLGC